jgi:FkbH-like protein
MKNILITSSSYLLNETYLWNNLKKNYKIKFSNYRFFNQILSDKDVQYFVLVLNFMDLIEYPISDFSKKNIYKIKKNIENLFNLIKKKLKYSSNPLILFVDYYYGNTAIKASQKFPPEEKLLDYIRSKVNASFKYPNFFYFNIDNFEKKKNLYDHRLYYFSKTRYSAHCINQISRYIALTLYRLENSPKKVLVLDCDNTLWGGIVGEDGYNGIKIGHDGEGEVFANFQKSILRLKNEGVILCLSSKNNLSDVTEVFRKNKNMILSLKDFAMTKVNWKSKSQNISELSKELNLSLNSFAFFDDNPIERDHVRKNLTDINVIEPHKDISYWPQQIFDNYDFLKFKLTKEDIIKTEQYKNRLKFFTEKKKKVNETVFLKNIKLKAKIEGINASNEQRCMQLIHKTNQFNLTTKRYLLPDIKKFKKNKKNKIFMVRLKDKYGDHGLIALFMTRKEKEYVYIDNFTMSCRVLGRYLEEWILKKIVTVYKQKNIQIIGEYVSTKKNVIVSDLYPKLGFKPIDEISKIPSNLRKFFSKKNKIFIVKRSDIKISNVQIYKN